MTINAFLFLAIIAAAVWFGAWVSVRVSREIHDPNVRRFLPSDEKTRP